MTDERSKRHHYIPKFLVKYWANRWSRVWVLNQQKHKIYPVSINDVFVENNRFTIQRDHDAPKSDEIEKLLARQESLVAPIIKSIVERARQKILLDISQLEVQICQKFLISITRRTPQAISRLFSDEDTLFFKAVSLLPNSEDHDWDDPSIRNNLKVRDLVRLTTGNSAAKFAAGQQHEHQILVQEYVNECGLLLVVLQNPKYSFLLGSCGCAEVPDQTNDKRIRRVTWFPITPDVAVAFTHDPEYLRVSYFECDEFEEKFSHKLNAATISSSDFVVAKQKDHLSPFTDFENRD